MKIAQWADYLQKLGIGAVLINPPLESDSHGYDTRSLRHIDRQRVGMPTLPPCARHCMPTASAWCSRCRLQPRRPRFWAFRDVQERKWDSPYKGLVPHQF